MVINTTQKQGQYFCKTFLKSVNKSLQAQIQSKRKFSILSAFHRWQYNYTFAKNFLILINRILRHFNSYHVFRKGWIVGFLATGFGFGLSYAEDKYLALQEQKQHRVPKLIIKNVLQNQIVADMLIKVLHNNIFLNPSIQYQLEQALMYLAIKPQTQNLFFLTKMGIIAGLNHPYTQDFIIDSVIKPQIPRLKQPILQYLNGANFQTIVTNGIQSVVRTQALHNIIRDNLISSTSNISNPKNMQSLYESIRQKIIWT